MDENKYSLRVINNNEAEEKPWYSEGLNFSCTQCGKCCTGRPGYTWVSLDEIEAIADHLKISLNEFASNFLRKVDGKWSLLEFSSSYDCVFLKDKRCSIYPVRPKQCRSFPWWKETLASKEAWDEAARFCEGIQENAPHHSLEEIQSQL